MKTLTCPNPECATYGQAYSDIIPDLMPEDEICPQCGTNLVPMPPHTEPLPPSPGA